MSGKKASEIKCCASCGTRAPRGALFCPHCGELIGPSSSYDESLPLEDAVVEETEKIREKPSKPSYVNVFQINLFPPLYEGVIHGLVTRERRMKFEIVFNDIIPVFFFVVKLEVGFEGVPDVVLVRSEKLCNLRIGDKVYLHVKIFKINLKRWSRPKYLILADRIYNESLNISDEEFVASTQVVYKGKIRGSVTRESTAAPRVPWPYSWFEAYPTIRLEENIEIEGIPDEIPFFSVRGGYFREGDKVILRGKIIKEDIRRLSRPMYLIVADYYYNESLQFGD